MIYLKALRHPLANRGMAVQHKLHPGRWIGVGLVLVGQPDYSANEGTTIPGHFEGIFVSFDLSPARPEVAQRHRHQAKDAEGDNEEGEGSWVGEAL